MVYKNKWETELLDSGVHDGYEYAIVSTGSHPCAYVKLPEEHKYYGVDYDDIPVKFCYGLFGLSYSYDFLAVMPSHSGWWIGWEYPPYFDYGGILDSIKWTTAEILDDVKDVIGQVKKL